MPNTRRAHVNNIKKKQIKKPVEKVNSAKYLRLFKLKTEIKIKSECMYVCMYK